MFTYVGVAAALVATILVVWRWRGYRRYRAIVWRTEDITAVIERDDRYLKIGQYLSLSQKLRTGETGWMNMKINLPERWEVRTVKVEHGRVLVEVKGQGAYVLDRRNIGELSFEILNGGDNKSDDVLERIWSKHAAYAA